MINKQDFKYYIDSIKNYIKKEILRCEHLNKAFPNAFEANLLNTDEELIDSFIHLLEKQTNDTNGWIKYYCWELDFGNENWRLKVYDKDEKEIPLTTIDDLWELLNSEKATLKDYHRGIAPSKFLLDEAGHYPTYYPIDWSKLKDPKLFKNKQQ